MYMCAYICTLDYYSDANYDYVTMICHLHQILSSYEPSCNLQSLYFTIELLCVLNSKTATCANTGFVTLWSQLPDTSS